MTETERTFATLLAYAAALDLRDALWAATPYSNITTQAAADLLQRASRLANKLRDLAVPATLFPKEP